MSPQPVQAVVRSLRLLEVLADAQTSPAAELGVIELARQSGLSAATAHRLLATLAGEGYVAQDSRNGRYRLGPRLLALGVAAESRIALLRRLAMPVMERLRDEFGETVNLAVLDRRHIIYVEQLESVRPVHAFYRQGNRVLAHASAAGKVLLASEPEELVASLGDHGRLQGLTAHTITSTDALRDHLRTVRAQGFALDLGEQDDEVVCVAAPIPEEGRAPSGALSLSGPAGRMRGRDLDAVGARVAELAANVFAGHAGHGP